MGVTARVGSIEIVAVTDGDAPPVDPAWPFPEVARDEWERHSYALDETGLHRSNFGSFVLRSASEVVLVDTGLGPHAPARFGTPPAKLPESLAAAGVRLDDVTTVVLTHLHYDHVGWALNSDGDGPMFPNARYLASETDWEHWLSSNDPERVDHEKTFRRRALPLHAMGVLELVKGEHNIAPGIRTLPTPGHTPGHMSLLLESSGQLGIVTGDVFHSSAQFARPEWSHRADIDPAVARVTRTQLLERMVPGVKIAAGHLLHGSNIGTVALVDGRKFWRGTGAGEVTVTRS